VEFPEKKFLMKFASSAVSFCYDAISQNFQLGVYSLERFASRTVRGVNMIEEG
jgi:hypothetical protein